MNRLNCKDAIRIMTLRKAGFDYHDGWLIAVKQGKNGTMEKVLANFLAWPVREIVVDDGGEQKRFVDIKGVSSSGVALEEVRLSYDDFMGNLPKVLSKHWGMDVIIKSRAKDDLREALQVLGRERKLETVFTHTGWRNIDGKWIFLHAGGAIGAENVCVELNEGNEVLNRYCFPTVVSEPIETAKVAFSLLNVGKHEITYPLFATVFLAPLSEVLRGSSRQGDFMPFLIGRTQSGKSSLAALFLSFFGDFDKNHFPANYKQTANSLERICFLLKDVLCVVDDFFPGQSNQERIKMKEMAQRLARAYGDGAVRQRLQGTKLQGAWAPRGLAISTGEERPEIGESGQARFVFIDVNRGDVNYEALLSLHQEHRSQLTSFMSLYLQWVSSNWDRIPALFEETYAVARNLLLHEEYSGRINESLAKLCGAMEVVLTFSHESGYITSGEYEEYGETAFQAFSKVLEENVRSLVTEKPTQKFVSAFREIIQQQPQRLCRLDANELPDEHLGCYDDDYFYIFPSVCFKAIQAYCKATATMFPVGDKTLWKHLRAENIIEGSDSRGRNTVQVRMACLEGKNVDVLKMPRIAFGIDE